MPILPSLFTAMLFFLIVPAIGIVISRSRWRVFRHAMKRAALRPRARREAIHNAHEGRQNIGEYRFFGTLEALQADDRLWLRDGQNSVEVDMSGTNVVLLPEQPPPSSVERTERKGFESLLYSMGSPDSVPWRQMTSLTEGTNVFVCAVLGSDNGVPVFRQDSRKAPLVVMYDGAPEQLLSRAIWYGRHRNEYWNFLTPLSLVAGMLVLVILSLGYLSSPATYASGILTLGFASIPVLPLLPPGVPGYFAYRKLWLKGRARRAWRDLLRLPLVYWDSAGRIGERITLPDGEPYVSVAIGSEDVQQYLDRGAVLRKGPDSHDADSWVVFGTPADDGLVRPSDPMAELVVLPNDPEQRSRKSAVLAYLWEICALLVLGVSVLINFTLFVRLLPLIL